MATLIISLRDYPVSWGSLKCRKLYETQHTWFGLVWFGLVWSGLDVTLPHLLVLANESCRILGE